MKRRKLHVVWLWGLLFLMTACGDDDYYYPSVKLEFVTVEAGEDGRIQTLIPDKGEVLTVSEDRTGSTISPNTSRRVMSNYEVLSGENTATIYSLQSLITPVPKPEDDPVYQGRYKAGSGRDGQYLAWKGLSEYDFESQGQYGQGTCFRYSGRCVRT